MLKVYDVLNDCFGTLRQLEATG